MRLLRIHAQQDDHIVRCSLESAELLHPPSYAALSYTWGAPTDQAAERGVTYKRYCPIVCNGEEILVTENLLHFLQRIARYDIGYWWIDAICINQDDVSERNTQVLLMTKIYSTARAVCVWLGEEDEFTVPALQLLRTLGSRSVEELLLVDPLSPCSTAGETAGLSVHESDWNALSWLFRRRWFSRVWVLQEATVVEPTLYVCGGYSIESKDLLTAARYLSNCPWTIHHGLGVTVEESVAIFTPPIRRVNDYALLVLYHMIERRHDYGSRLATAIIQCRISKSSDPRDKIYAFLGYFDGPQSERQSYSLMFPDYRKPVSRIYFEATDYLMRNTGDLLVLSMVEDSLYRKQRDLPSWVPDYSVTFVTGIGYHKRGVYSASQNLKSQGLLRPEDLVLSLNASMVDVITDIAEPKREIVDEGRCQHLLPIVAGMDESYFTAQTRMEAFWRTLIGDSYEGEGSQSIRQPPKGQSSAPDSLRKPFRAWLLFQATNWLVEAKKIATSNYAAVAATTLASLDKLSKHDSSGIIPLPEEVRQFIPHVELLDTQMAELVDASLPFETAFLTLSETRFFRTHGGLMGLGPLSMTTGDTIWLAPGAEVFLVLRQKPGSRRFQFIGDAYVHGLMHGEACERAKYRIQNVELE